MAIVRTIHHPQGATVYIDDACYRDASPEEIARRWQEIDRVILRIDREVQLRRLAEQQEESARTRNTKEGNS